MTTLPAHVPPAELAVLPHGLAIRPMLVSDLDAVMVIEQQSLSAPWAAAGYAHELRNNTLATYQVLQRSISAETHLLGYVGHWIIADECHISIIAVAPQWRRRRLGELLLLGTLFVALSQQATLVTLEVRRSNTIAQSLYSKYRFEKAGVRKGYYRDTGEDGLIMTVQPLDGEYQRFLHTQCDELISYLTTRLDTE
ncbi:MAG: ribosomal protein S18-alanine N-acetyltransferase [Anaerolineae bacterium]|nr:ribosomal protein S18-alanine N-acetyltransferase [Anaerolineae bacterium]MCO5186856.1 ribosomal protein S18-alanine N-acetyltransferase [Anaerolineae bacterium]MCO5199935.1 ribosomal protein S18-alanine N-acetyltransferase [Anaerolineae bacterium]